LLDATARHIVKIRVATAVLALGTAVITYSACLFLPASKRVLIDLKNRTAIPAASDYDPKVSLKTLLERGDDRARWSTARAGRVEGHVVAVHAAGLELANRLSPRRRDTHVEVGARPDASPRERVVLEVTPPMRDLARQQGLDWSTTALQRDLVGKVCRFEGWLLFDIGHANESENTNPGDPDNWRATAWELHPVTSITCH
jgi:hypothetical protein